MPITDAALCMVPETTTSPSSALSMMTRPVIGAWMVVLRSSSSAFSRSARAWLTCSFACSTRRRAELSASSAASSFSSGTTCSWRRRCVRRSLSPASARSISAWRTAVLRHRELGLGAVVRRDEGLLLELDERLTGHHLVALARVELLDARHHVRRDVDLDPRIDLARWP